MKTNIKELRKAKGLSIYSLAKTTGVTRSYLGKIEKETHEPSFSILKRIAKALETTVLELIKE
jgi:transcriptional regulator with XRE-family HTH domain